jgi:biotin carboxyl carrier protein
VPEPVVSDGGREARGDVERAVDHAAIDRLTGELLPALIAKLGATGLGELEVREGEWRVRLRRPAGSSVPRDRRAGDRPGTDRSGDRGSERPPRGQHLHGHAEPPTSARTDSKSVATSPAVGVYQPRNDLTVGARVRAGDRIGAVDMLGVAQEVVAPMDGIVGESLVEPGDAVEYGQELVVIDFGVELSTNGTGAS